MNIYTLMYYKIVRYDSHEKDWETFAKYYQVWKPIKNCDFYSQSKLAKFTKNGKHVILENSLYPYGLTKRNSWASFS